MPNNSLAELLANLAKVLRGKESESFNAVLALLSGGHVLLEDVPGTGKTTLAKAIARSIEGSFRRIQFTPDLLPADITGSSVYRPTDGTFEFREGPVFANVVLADEINRTSARTQAALLEVMSENQVTLEGVCRSLPQPFFVVATQNPADFHGTYPLPEAQLDRFLCRLRLGYPGHDDEMEMLYDQRLNPPIDRLQPVMTNIEISELQSRVKQVHVERSVAEYLLRLVEHVRHRPGLRLGPSPRASMALFRMAQARALCLDRRGHDDCCYVVPEDVRVLAKAVLAHRIHTDSRNTGVQDAESIVDEALATIAVPR
jgi:MoxR-like ATPase